MPRIRVVYQYSELNYTRLWLRWASMAAASACFMWAGFTWLERYEFQRASSEEFEHPVTERMSASKTSLDGMSKAAPTLKLDIPRLQVSGFVEDGLSTTTLRHAIGRAPSSAQLGEAGNVVLAAHRDTFFAGLRDVKLADRIHLRTSDGRRFTYQVTQVSVVEPDAGWVMDPDTEKPTITLITCYPFRFVGPAPQRLVVRAELATSLPGSTVLASNASPKHKENKHGR